MNERLKKLYQSIILKNNNDPFHFEKREDATFVLEAYNQICGDRFNLFFELENDRISNISFHGFGCAISKASTSILVKHLDGVSMDDAPVFLDKFLKTVNPEAELLENTPEDFLAFEAAKEFPGRLKCATLSWDAFNEFLESRK